MNLCARQPSAAKTVRRAPTYFSLSYPAFHSFFPHLAHCHVPQSQFLQLLRAVVTDLLSATIVPSRAFCTWANFRMARVQRPRGRCIIPSLLLACMWQGFFLSSTILVVAVAPIPPWWDEEYPSPSPAAGNVEPVIIDPFSTATPTDPPLTPTDSTTGESAGSGSNADATGGDGGNSGSSSGESSSPSGLPTSSSPTSLSPTSSAPGESEANGGAPSSDAGSQDSSKSSSGIDRNNAEASGEWGNYYNWDLEFESTAQPDFGSDTWFDPPSDLNSPMYDSYSDATVEPSNIVQISDGSSCSGGTIVGVEGIEGLFCVTSTTDICSGANFSGKCPTAGSTLPYGSHCGRISATGVAGCIPGQPQTEGPQYCDLTAGWMPVSVVGAGTFCVKGKSCVGQVSDGTCPGPQEFLPLGSKCEWLPTGVYGCVKVDGTPSVNASRAVRSLSAPSSPISDVSFDVRCKTGTEISVVGIPEAFCLNASPDQVCVGQNSGGLCPSEDPERLPYGAHCGLISSTGAYGCIPGNPMSPRLCRSGFSDSATPVSVVGVGTFCVEGTTPCSGVDPSGQCPLPQLYLPFGSYCGLIYDQVYGCIPHSPQSLAFNVKATFLQSKETVTGSSPFPNGLMGRIIGLACAAILVGVVAVFHRGKSTSRHELQAISGREQDGQKTPGATVVKPSGGPMFEVNDKRDVLQV